MTEQGRMSPGRAFVEGAGAVIQAPLVLVMVVLVTMLAAVPFAAVLGARVQASLATQPPVALDETEIDPEWWQEFRAHARGLEATFTPAIVGFAAALDGISAILDGRRPPLALVGPLTLSIGLWAFLWGGILRRFAAGRAIGPRAFLRAAAQSAPRFLGIALAAAIAVVILYATVHAALFGPVYRWLVPHDAAELSKFLVRVLLYIVFMTPVALVGLVADYARTASTLGRAGSLAGSIRAGAMFVRTNPRAVASLYLITGAVFVVLTVAYGALEIYGGSQVGGWRAIAIGQIYILVRLAIRLTTAAAELRLFATGTTP